MKCADDYKYRIYVDRKDGCGWELASWYDDDAKVRKEVAFMKRRGYDVKVVTK